MTLKKRIKMFRVGSSIASIQYGKFKSNSKNIISLHCSTTIQTFLIKILVRFDVKEIPAKQQMH